MSAQTHECCCSDLQAGPCKGREELPGEPWPAPAVFPPEARGVATRQWQGDKGRVGAGIFAQSPFCNSHGFTQAERSVFYWVRPPTQSPCSCPRTRWKGVNVSQGPLASAFPLLTCGCSFLGRLRPRRWTLPGKTDSCREVYCY